MEATIVSVTTGRLQLRRRLDMKELYAQGDLLIERVADIPPSGTITQTPNREPIVLAEGETTGHRHAIHDRVTMFRDDSLARDMPSGLYIGHVQVDVPFARLEHDEHAPLSLPRGTYRV